MQVFYEVKGNGAARDNCDLVRVAIVQICASDSYAQFLEKTPAAGRSIGGKMGNVYKASIKKRENNFKHQRESLLNIIKDR